MRGFVFPDQPGIELFPFLLVIRAPGGVGALRVVTGGSPVPFAGVTEENVHAETLSDPEFKLVYPAGAGSFFHLIWTSGRDTRIDYISLDKVARNSALFLVLASLSSILCVTSP